jgi:adenylate kinase family enzyme
LRKVAVIASASGNGKTTVGRELASRLDVPFVELDALVHGPNWTETSDAGLRALLEPVLARDGWVVDGGYRGKIGDLVISQADIVLWLDLPVRVWLPRLLRRTARRIRGHEDMWNGNKESLRSAFWGNDALIPFAIRSHRRRRRDYPAELGRYTVVRLRTQAEIDAFLSAAGAP